MNVVQAHGLTYRYGRVAALDAVEFAVPEGALYALLGPNGSGKTTLLQILMGVRRPDAGRASVLGVDTTRLSARDRSRIGYIAEGQALPAWMRLDQLERYLAPLYENWDAALARELRERFELDPTRKIRAMSRGEQMKAALLCALAPRPKLLVMDEPFTGMDALVKDDLVRGLLASSATEGWTVLLCSHDIGELELLADWVGFLDHGRMRLSEPMDRLRERFKRVEATLRSDRSLTDMPKVPPEWMAFERAGHRITFIAPDGTSAAIERTLEQPIDQTIEQTLITRFGAAHVASSDATLREVFVALARRSVRDDAKEVAA